MAGEIVATRHVPARIEAVFGYLSRLENHWRLADRWIDVLELRSPPGGPKDAPADRGRVRIRGPLGIGRTARTLVIGAEPPLGMHGSAEVGAGTRAHVSWSFADRDGATEVSLSSVVERTSAFDRLLLALGGRAWLRRRFRSVLANLEALFADQEPASARNSSRVRGSSRISP